MFPSPTGTRSGLRKKFTVNRRSAAKRIDSSGMKASDMRHPAVKVPRIQVASERARFFIGTSLPTVTDLPSPCSARTGHCVSWKLARGGSKSVNPDLQTPIGCAALCMTESMSLALAMIRCFIKVSLLYGKNCMARAQQAQTKNSRKIRVSPRGVDSEKRLRIPHPTSSRRKSHAPRQPLPHHRSSSRIPSPFSDFSYYFPRTRFPRSHPRRDESQLVVF